MEFGYVAQGYLPERLRRLSPDSEHIMLQEEFDLCVQADKAKFKYSWIPEHHFTPGYSHISANDIFLGALAKVTSQMHLGSGIWNPLPRINHPAVLAERVAMLDHLSEGRVEFGTGRGSGSQEVLGFYPEFEDASGTREIWEETIGEFVKMWTQDVYEGFEGAHWSLAQREVLPKPYKNSHPAMWYAAGNPASWEMAARKGLGVLGFSLGAGLNAAENDVAKYHEMSKNAEPVGAFVNNNVAISINSCYVHEDREVARQEFLSGWQSEYIGYALHYHDQIPRSDDFPVWPELPPAPDETALDTMIELGAAIVGDPDDCLKQFQRWADTGVDQIMVGTASKSYEQNSRMISLLGEHVIPKLDTDPVHSTTRYRDAAGI